MCQHKCLNITLSFIYPLVSADNGDVPIELQAKLLLTAFTDDRNVGKRVNEELDIGILYFPEFSQSRKEALDFYNTLEGFKDKKISGRSFDMIVLTYSNNDDLKKKIVDKNINIVYIARGNKNLVEQVLKLTQSNKLLSCASRSEYVTGSGVTIAVGLKENKPKIYINLSSAKAEGVDFSAKFLRITEIVGSNDRQESTD